MRTPSPDEIESILQRIDDGDISDEAAKTPATFAEGVRVGIMWATGQLETDPV